MQSYDVVIVGAGISGLSAAYELHRRGADVLVVEAREEVGGAIRSERTSDGFVVENGPNTVVSRSAELEQHLEDLGIAEQRVVANRHGARRFVFLNGQPELLPSSPPTFLRSPVLSPWGKLRLLAEPFLPKAATADESVATFFARRLGPELVENIIDPFVSGVYAGDPHQLSAPATFPAIWQAEQRAGSIVTGMLTTPRTKTKGPRRASVMLSFQDGLQTWPRAIAATLGPERLWLQQGVIGVQPSGRNWTVTVAQPTGEKEIIQTRKVVLTVPTVVLAELISQLEPQTAAMLQGVFYPPLSIVHLGYRRADVAHPLDGFGMLCPAREQRRVLGVLWPSSLFPGRAPDNTVLTTSFVGGARAPEQAQQDDEHLIEMVIDEHRVLIGAQSEPIFARVARWERAIPQYVAGHQQRITAIEQLETLFHGLHILGNFRNGVSVERCWQKGYIFGRELTI